MLTIPVTTLCASLILGGALPTEPAILPGAFRVWFDAAADGRLAIPGPIASRASHRRYVFVAGLQNERMPGYFAQNIAALRDLGVPAEAIHRLGPSSDGTFEQNIGALRVDIHALASIGPEPLVIIGHSRGACDALAFALREPRFVRERVEAIFLVQGPFGGSGVADYVLGEGEPMDRRMPRPARAAANLIGKAESIMLRRGRHSGIEDLASDSARRFWDRQLDERPEAAAVVGPRTYYLEGLAPPGAQPLFRRPVARYLETYYGPNDGMVAEGDQYLDGLGTRLGTFDVGHTDLTHRFPAARPKRRLRRALAEAVVMAVGRRPRHAPKAGGDS